MPETALVTPTSTRCTYPGSSKLSVTSRVCCFLGLRPPAGGQPFATLSRQALCKGKQPLIKAGAVGLRSPLFIQAWSCQNRPSEGRLQPSEQLALLPVRPRGPAGPVGTEFAARVPRPCNGLGSVGRFFLSRSPFSTLIISPLSVSTCHYITLHSSKLSSCVISKLSYY